MRQEHDEEADVMILTYSENPIVNSHEYTDGPVRYVRHFDKDQQVVRTEIHGFSKLEERRNQTKRNHYTADPHANQTIGHLDWSITDTATGQIIAEGSTGAQLSQIIINTIESPDKTPQASKMLQLTETFSFALATSLQPTPDLVGFALKADRIDEQTFCWDWFNIDGPDHAAKIQEHGELQIALSNPNEQWQIIRTEFLTDVSLRVSRFTGSGDPRQPDWRVLIRKGSWMDWPAVIDGEVKAAT